VASCGPVEATFVYIWLWFILGGLGEQSPSFLKVGVDVLVISTNC